MNNSDRSGLGMGEGILRDSMAIRTLLEQGQGRGEVRRRVWVVHVLSPILSMPTINSTFWLPFKVLPNWKK